MILTQRIKTALSQIGSNVWDHRIGLEIAIDQVVGVLQNPDNWDSEVKAEAIIDKLGTDFPTSLGNAMTLDDVETVMHIFALHQTVECRKENKKLQDVITDLKKLHDVEIGKLEEQISDLQMLNTSLRETINNYMITTDKDSY